MGLKITFVLPHLTLSGGNKVTLMYADRLAARGHEVTVVHGWMPRMRDRLAQRLFGRLGFRTTMLEMTREAVQR